MAQYDEIGSEYDFVKTTPFNGIEQPNFRRALQPLFANRDCHVLELASGTGFYSERMLRWGAASVTGVDISMAMVEAANKRLEATDWAPKATFIHGDGREHTVYTSPSSNKFDVVAGTWFLNYAESYAELVSMFKTIAINLNDRGVFVGICLPPVEEFADRINSCAADAVSRTGVRYLYGAPLESGEGYKFRCTAFDHTRPEALILDFDTFHLRKSLYEAAAVEGGMAGRQQWHDCDFDVADWRHKIGLQNDDDAWEKLKKAPHMCILTVSKN